MKRSKGEAKNILLFILLILIAALISVSVFDVVIGNLYYLLYLVPLIIILIALFVALIFKSTSKDSLNDSKNTSKLNINESKTINRLKKKSDLYFNISKLNKTYKLKSLEPFVNQYDVASKDILANCNMDEYLLMTIKDRYNELKEYKIKYDENLKLYNEYLNEYSDLEKYINEEEAEKLKIPYDLYKKCQKLILKENKNKVSVDFVVDLSVVFKGKNDKIISKKHHKYYKDEFSKLIQEFLELRRNGNLNEIEIRVEKSKLSESLINKVLKRDKNKCKLCGSVAKGRSKLKVDYIMPVEDGGKTELDNLQTVCSKCSKNN